MFAFVLKQKLSAAELLRSKRSNTRHPRRRSGVRRNDNAELTDEATNLLQWRNSAIERRFELYDDASASRRVEQKLEKGLIILCARYGIADDDVMSYKALKYCVRKVKRWGDDSAPSQADLRDTYVTSSTSGCRRFLTFIVSIWSAGNLRLVFLKIQLPPWFLDS
jgi:hypothetical protein